MSSTMEDGIACGAKFEWQKRLGVSQTPRTGTWSTQGERIPKDSKQKCRTANRKASIARNENLNKNRSGSVS